MTDRQFELLIHRAIGAATKANILRRQAEEEYERRFGTNPSDCDDDNWIDVVHIGGEHGEKYEVKVVDGDIIWGNNGSSREYTKGFKDCYGGEL